MLCLILFCSHWKNLCIAGSFSTQNIFHVMPGVPLGKTDGFSWYAMRATRPERINGQNYQKQKEHGTSDQSLFRLWSKFRKIPVLVMYYIVYNPPFLLQGLNFLPNFKKVCVCVFFKRRLQFLQKKKLKSKYLMTKNIYKQKYFSLSYLWIQTGKF